jgi:hypothetical protein
MSTDVSEVRAASIIRAMTHLSTILFDQVLLFSFDVYTNDNFYITGTTAVLDGF